MTDRRERYDTRNELRKVNRNLLRLAEVVLLLANRQFKTTTEVRETRLESRRQNQGTRAVVYRAAANFWDRPGLTEIPRNTFGEL